MKAFHVRFAIGLLLLPPQVFAQFNFFSNGSGITISGYTGSGGAVTIPTNINNMTVTSIGDNAFNVLYGKGFLVTSMTIPSTVTNIGLNAFEGCGQLMSINLGTGVTSIGNDAFDGCTSLGNLVIPDSVTSIGTEAFEDCTHLTSISIGTNVTTIGGNAFNNCGSLATIAIPNSVTSIGINAFYFCTGMTAITVGAQNPVFSSVGGVLFDKNQTALLAYPGARAGSYVIPDSVTSLGNGALWNCVGLTGVSISSNITSLGNAPFSGCSNLLAITVDPHNSVCSSVDGVLFDKAQTTLLQFPGGRGGSYVIPGGVASIGMDAFAYSDNLVSVTISRSVTGIGFYAFGECYGLTRMLFEGNVPADIEMYAFFFDTNTTVYFLPGTSGWGSFAGPPTVLWNPSIQTADGHFGIQDNQFGFTITSTADIPIVVEGCLDLGSPVWSPLTNVTLTNGLFYFSEPMQMNLPGRYFRIGFP